MPQAISSAVTSSLSVCGCVVFFRIVGAVLLAVLPLPPTAVSAALEVSAGCADFAALGGAAAATGIGTILSPLPSLPACWLVIAKPDCGVSTAEAYRLVDRLLLAAR